MEKTCTLCKKALPLDAFNKKKRNKDGLQNVCRVCNQEKSRLYYKNNKEKHLKVIRQNRDRYADRNARIVEQLKLEFGCAFCQESETCCLEFHHLGNKDRSVSRLVKGGWSWETVAKEINKCVCVCRNCHAKIHTGLLVTNEDQRCCIDINEATTLTKYGIVV